MDKLIPVNYDNQRILLTSQLAESYETTERRISENFTRNQDHYIEGKHFYCLEGDEKRDFIDRTQIADSLKNASVLYLWTEKGALLHAKSLGTDKAWEVYDLLVETYFEAKKAKPMSQAEIIAAQANLLVEVERKSNAALESANKANKRLDNALNALSKPSEPDWQTSTGNRIKAVAAENQLSYLKFFGDLYKELEDTAHVNLTSRVSRMKERMKKAGHTYKELDKVTKLHVISCDPVLKLAFDGVVRRCEAKYAIVER